MMPPPFSVLWPTEKVLFLSNPSNGFGVFRGLRSDKNGACKIPKTYIILLMEEILHQLMGSLSLYLQGFIHPRWCRISSINSIGSDERS